MIYSNERKLTLSGWLKENSFKEYDCPLKLQKYLLFYELFSKVEGEESDFSSLRGYKRGPVFSKVWGDYTKERCSFDSAAAESFKRNKQSINISRARKCAFIVGTLTEKELSELTHKLNLWSSKKDRIMNNEYQVSLDESDFNSNDSSIISLLGSMYPDLLVENSYVLGINDNYFVIDKQDALCLTEQNMDTLAVLSEKEELQNPVFVSVDSNGGLLID